MKLFVTKAVLRPFLIIQFLNYEVYKKIFCVTIKLINTIVIKVIIKDAFHIKQMRLKK